MRDTLLPLAYSKYLQARGMPESPWDNIRCHPKKGWGTRNVDMEPLSPNTFRVGYFRVLTDAAPLKRPSPEVV